MSRLPDLVRVTETRPLLWRNLQLVRYRNSRLIGQIVSPDHHIVLEGFPRSGNSYSVRAFLFANGTRRTWSIAHHFHRLPQVTLGVRWKRPTVVLMREPDAAVVSLIAHSIMVKNSAPKSYPDALKACFDRWWHYYENVFCLRDQLVLSDFSATTKRFDLVMDAVNDRFGSDFHGLSPTDVDARTEIFDTGGSHLSPNPGRDEIKAHLKKLLGDPSLQKSRTAAARTYEKLRAAALVVT